MPRPLKGTRPFQEAIEQPGLLLWMAISSVLGALLGSASFGVVPSAALSMMLAAILAASAVKLYRG